MDLHGVAVEPALERIYGRVPTDGALVRLRGDASSRTYYRLHVSTPGATTPETAIVMHLPEDPSRSDEGTSRSTGAGRPPRDDLPFLTVHALLEARGVPVPRVLDVDLPNRVVVLEDLGDTTFEARLHATPRAEWPALYAEAVDLLAALHERCDAPEPDQLVYTRRFDAPLLRWELDHFREWGLEALYGPLEPRARERLDATFDTLAERLAAAPTGFVHRDFQSRNLMYAPSGKLTVIDFQDALIGPTPYDLVALLCDSYVEVDGALTDAMLDRYAAARALSAAERRQFHETFWRLAVQRKLKDAGRFVFIDRVRGNPSFLRWYAPSLVYVGRALDRVPDLAPLRSLLARTVPGFPSDCATPTHFSRTEE